MSFLSQLLGFLKRNLILKYRNKFQTFPEIYNPITILIVLVVFNYTFKPVKYSPVEYPAQDLVISSIVNYNVFIYPANANTTYIGNQLTMSRFFVRYFASVNDMKATYLNLTKNSSMFDTYYGIEFFSSSAQSPSYKLYTLWDQNVFTNKKVVTTANGNICREQSTYSYPSCAGNVFFYNGLSYLQNKLNLAIKKLNNPTYTEPAFKVQNMPKDTYILEQAIFTAITSYYFTIFFINSLITFVTNIVAEKEHKIKEVMRMMGMYDSAFWISWIAVYMIFFTLLNLTITIILGAISFFRTVALSIIFFILFELFAIVTIIFGMLFSTFFQKSKSAGAACAAAYTVLSLLYFVVFLPREAGVDIPIPVQWVLSLMFPCAFSLAIDQALFTQTVYGDQFPIDLIAKATRPNSLSILDCMIMLLIDGFIYFLITLYLDNVIQGEYGTAKPFWFCLSPSYWIDKRKKSNYQVYGEDANIELDNSDYEHVPDDYKSRVALKIHNLVKKFKNEEKQTYNAIDNLSMTIYANEITAILGHNGAGKTTLFNILTGLIKADSGSAWFFNYNVNSPNDMFRIRKMCGICPQQDVLYELLNCTEHLELYARLKGIKSSEIKAKTEELLKSVDLFDSRTTLSKDLSGGQKRKLCIAIALIGDPKILILDEPTSGMDPSSRRAIWNLLQSMRHDKVILLTTHFMDEADILADRKAILNKGKLTCIGSSLFLKTRFGVGYHLNCIMKRNFDREPYELTDFLRRYVPDCKLERYHANEASFTLPLNSSAQFHSLFEAIETSSKALEIEYFAISMTNLEEVFLKLGENGHHDANSNSRSHLSTPLSAQDVNLKRESINQSAQTMITESSRKGFKETRLGPKFLNCLPVKTYAMFKLRFLLSFRNKLAFIYRFIVPLPSIILTILLPKIISSSVGYDPNNLPSINLEINDYATVKHPFGLINQTGQNMEQILGNSFVVNTNLTTQPTAYVSDIRQLNGQAYAGTQFNAWTSRTSHNFTLLYNDSALLSIPYLVHTLTNFYSRYDGQPLINASLSAWPRTTDNTIANTIDYSSFTALIVLGTGLVMPLVTFAVEIVYDKETKTQSQIRLSGAGFLTYWGVSFVAFLIQYMVLPIILFVIIYAIPPLNIASFQTLGAGLAILFTTIIYVPCLLMVSLCFSFFFTKKETAISVLATVFMLLFIIPYMAVNLSQLAGTRTANIVHLVFTFVDPIYGFVGTYNRIAQVYIYQQIQNIILNTNDSPPVWLYFEFDIFFIPISLIFGIINFFVYFGLIYYIDSFKHGINLLNYIFDRNRVVQRRPNIDQIQDEDSDVSSERARVEDAYIEDSPLILQQIRKEFAKPTSISSAFANFGKKNNSVLPLNNKKIAVRNLSIGFKTGEIFGLLGPNGAGKTTAISIITTEVIPDAGTVKILNHPMNIANIDMFCHNVGLCPQHNPLWEDLTLREHLVFYACMKNLSRDEVAKKCDELMHILDIEEHADKMAKNLSGGTKRKLSFAISTFASPKVVLLDEPSTGLDPKSKRTFWNVISNILATHDKCAILTTHSMEEAEALCQRIGIVVKGELKCLGSSQYLKEKFGMGYTLETKIEPQYRNEFFNIIQNLFNQEATLTEEFSNRYVFNVPKHSIKSLSKIFERLESAKSNGIIIEYNFSQCTLEQVFIKFAKQQDIY